MTTTLTRPMYGVDLTSPAARELLAFQAGETDTLPSTPFEDWCREQAAARRAGQDARWADLREYLEHWAKAARTTLRECPHAPSDSGVRIALALCQSALDEMTKLESSA
jgi:hypothetical protein